MVTLSDWVSAWIDMRSITLKPNTVNGYRLTLRKYITPSPAGSKALDALEPEDLLLMLSPIIGTGCTRAAQLTQIIVNAALKAAIKQRIIDRNPMDQLDRIRHHKNNTPFLTIEQASMLLKSSEDSPYHIAWMLGICCGLRRGEILGLRWIDVDLAGGWLHIRRQRVRIGGIMTETTPKSDASIRDIPISDEVATDLRALRRSGSNYVLEIAGAPVSDRQLRIALDRDLMAARLPRITLHGLRHTMAAIAASNEIAIKTLQPIMGHANFSTTADVYAHVDNAAQRAAISTISAVLRSKVARLEIV